MTPINTNYLRDLGRIQQARSCGAQALEETSEWRAVERIEELKRQPNGEGRVWRSPLPTPLSGNIEARHPDSNPKADALGVRLSLLE